MSSRLLTELPRLLEQHGRLAMATIVSAVGSTPRETTARMLVLPDGSTLGTIGGGRFESLVLEDARKLLDAHGLPFTREYDFIPAAFGAVCGGKVTVLLEVVERAPHLLVVGAGHCGRALARAARFTGWDVTVADERPEQLDPAAFPEGVRLVRVRDDYSDLPVPGPRDSVALVSRGHATDGRAFRRLRGIPLAYLGMIGSKAKRKALFDELRAEGFSEEELARAHNPIGLPISAESPEEIAISIVAELIASRRGTAGRT
ncbi:MAG TPA: XdhC/CoxI family protein [Thermoanaerobaculia bacterium]|nr:XdhC/CoxI family protein [Thermoanaerobaculia bacterium]